LRTQIVTKKGGCISRAGLIKKRTMNAIHPILSRKKGVVLGESKEEGDRGRTATMAGGFRKTDKLAPFNRPKKKMIARARGKTGTYSSRARVIS